MTLVVTVSVTVTTVSVTVTVQHHVLIREFKDSKLYTSSSDSVGSKIMSLTCRGLQASFCVCQLDSAQAHYLCAFYCALLRIDTPAHFHSGVLRHLKVLQQSIAARWEQRLVHSLLAH